MSGGIDLQATQRGLMHLVGGRAIGVALGFAVLAVMWRRVPAAALGHYLALLALLEALYLASGVGLSTLAQRHLPEWRWQARSVDRTALGLLGLRVLLGVAAGGLVALAWAPLNRLLGLDGSLVPAWLFVLWMGLGSAARSLEELQASFMMQDSLQGLAVIGHLLRLPALLSLSEPGTAVWLIQLELAVVGMLTAVGLWWMRTRLSRQGPDAGASSSGSAPDLREGLKAWRLGLRFWGIQLLGLGFGSSAVRLAVAVLGGPVAVAFHGAAQAVVDAVRNALPVTLLAGWLRPALLRLHLLGARADAPPQVLGQAVFKLSMLLLIPVAALCVWEAPSVLETMIGSELMAQAHTLSLSSPHAPPPSAILLPMLAAAALQAAHQVRSLHCLTISAPAPAERATRWAAALALPTMALAWPWLGVWSAPVGVIVAELAWVALADRGLADRGLGRPVPADLARWVGLLGIAVLGAAMVTLGARALGGAGADSATEPPPIPWAWTLAALLVAAGGTGWGIGMLRPLRADETAILLTHLPDPIRQRAGQALQRLRSVVRRVRAVRQLGLAFAHDAWSYARGSGLLRQGRTAAQAQLLKTAHRIDKGLALPAPRPGFGREALLQLDRQLQTFATHHGADWAWDEAVRTVARYRLHQMGPEGDRGTRASEPTGPAGPVLDPGIRAVLARWGAPSEAQDAAPAALLIPESAVVLTREAVQAQARGSFESLVRSRRSVRQFAGDEVPRSLLEQAVALAAHTPSVCNRAGARVWAVFDADRRRTLLRHQNGHHGFADRASALLIVSVRPEVFDSVGERHQGWIDGGLFAMTLILALHEQGLGTCCLNWSVGPEVDAAFKRDAGLPRDELVVMLVAVGTLPPVFTVAHSPRRPLGELLSWLDDRPFPSGDEQS